MLTVNSCFIVVFIVVVFFFFCCCCLLFVVVVDDVVVFIVIVVFVFAARVCVLLCVCKNTPACARTYFSEKRIPENGDFGDYSKIFSYIFIKTSLVGSLGGASNEYQQHFFFH